MAATTSATTPAMRAPVATRTGGIHRVVPRRARRGPAPASPCGGAVWQLVHEAMSHGVAARHVSLTVGERGAWGCAACPRVPAHACVPWPLPVLAEQKS